MGNNNLLINLIDNMIPKLEPKINGKTRSIVTRPKPTRGVKVEVNTELLWTIIVNKPPI